MKAAGSAIVVALLTAACVVVLTAACVGVSQPSPTPRFSPSPTSRASVVASASAQASASPAARSLSEADAQRAVGTLVRDTLTAFKGRDGAALASLAHPDKGVRFSPYAFMSPTNITLTAAQLRNGFSDPSRRTWGITDGRGDPIVLSFTEYSGQYIYARDFGASSQIAYNRTIGRGNSLDNTADLYPDAILFEAYDAGPDPRLSDVQWQAVRLLFEKVGDRWYLVAVVHGEWTI